MPKCRLSRDGMPIHRCIHNQKEALRFFGPEAERFGSCPCDKGRENMKIWEEGMATKIGNCPGCGRENLKLSQSYRGTRICSPCRSQVERAENAGYGWKRFCEVMHNADSLGRRGKVVDYPWNKKPVVKENLTTQAPAQPPAEKHQPERA